MSHAKLSLKAITDVSKFLEIESAWNNFIKGHSDNPFLLSGFVRQFIDFYQAQGWVSALLVFSVNHMIVGIAPLRMRTNSGIRFAKLLLIPSYFPDFVLEEQYRQPCIDLAFDFLFNILNCQFVYLTLTSESATFPSLKRSREDRRMRFFTKREMGHYTISITYSWDDFEKSKGKRFRRDFRTTERRLNSIGSWKVTCFEKGDEEIVNKILEVERMSWKDKCRGRKTDDVLMMLLRGSQYTAEKDLDFKYKVWMLELDHKPIAYALVIQYKGVAYFPKMSYDASCKSFSPGIYIMSCALRELFNDQQVRKIDFHSDYQWVERWASFCPPRVGILMHKSRILAALISLSRSNRATKRIVALILWGASILKILPSWAYVSGWMT